MRQIAFRTAPAGWARARCFFFLLVLWSAPTTSAYESWTLEATGSHRGLRRHLLEGPSVGRCHELLSGLLLCPTKSERSFVSRPVWSDRLLKCACNCTCYHRRSGGLDEPSFLPHIGLHPHRPMPKLTGFCAADQKLSKPIFCSPSNDCSPAHLSERRSGASPAS